MNILRTPLLAAIAAFALSPAFAQDAFAQDHAITVDDAYARISPSGAGAIFFTMHNSEGEDDRLIAARVDKSLVDRAELHTHVEDAGGVMRMIEVKDGFPVPAGDSRLLESGGAHIMLMGLNKALKDGDSFPLTLVFEHAPELEVEVTVDNARGAGRSHGDHSGHGDHDSHGDHDAH